jgi:hypothetical protein
MNHLHRHMNRVREGRDVDAAKSFANYLFWSGIPALLKENSTAANELGPLKCDGPHLSWFLNELIDACNEYYRTNRAAGLQATELESIRDKLDKLASNQDLIAGQLSKLTTGLAPAEPDHADVVPRFHVDGDGVGAGRLAAPAPDPVRVKESQHNRS